MQTWSKLNLHFNKFYCYEFDYHQLKLVLRLPWRETEPPHSFRGDDHFMSHSVTDVTSPGDPSPSPMEKLERGEVRDLPKLTRLVLSRERMWTTICHSDLVNRPWNLYFLCIKDLEIAALGPTLSPYMSHMAHKLRMAFAFLSCWEKKSKGESYIITH